MVAWRSIEFGHVGWPSFGQMVLAVADDMDLDGGSSAQATVTEVISAK
jgi:hypothetical protein